MLDLEGGGRRRRSKCLHQMMGADKGLSDRSIGTIQRIISFTDMDIYKR